MTRGRRRDGPAARAGAPAGRRHLHRRLGAGARCAPTRPRCCASASRPRAAPPTRRSPSMEERRRQGEVQGAMHAAHRRARRTGRRVRPRLSRAAARSAQRVAGHDAGEHREAEPVVQAEGLEAALARALADQRASARPPAPRPRRCRAGTPRPRPSDRAERRPDRQKAARSTPSPPRTSKRPKRDGRGLHADPAGRRRGRPSRIRCRRPAPRTGCRAAATRPAAGHLRHCTAAKAIGMPKLKAMPSTACGIETKRLAIRVDQRDRQRRERPAAPSSRLVVSTSAKAASASTAPSTSASRTDTAPLVTGRCAVRLTWRSKSRSATSLTQQPALRIRIVPSTNTASRCQPGKPSAAIHSAPTRRPQQQQPAGRAGSSGSGRGRAQPRAGRPAAQVGAGARRGPARTLSLRAASAASRPSGRAPCSAASAGRRSGRRRPPRPPGMNARAVRDTVSWPLTRMRTISIALGGVGGTSGTVAILLNSAYEPGAEWPSARMRSAIGSTAFHSSVYCAMNIACSELNMRPGHVPVEVVRRQVQRVGVGQHAAQAVGDRGAVLRARCRC